MTEKNRYSVLTKLGDEKNLFLGTLAGIVEAFITQPLTYLKNSLQQRDALKFNPRIWWRGSYASCACDGILIGCQFMVCGFLQKQLLRGEYRALSMSEEMFAGFTAGGISGLPCCVLELTMIQQQRFGGTPINTIFRLYSTHGLSIILRGLGPSSGREAIFAAGYLGLSPQIERFFERRTNKGSKLGQLFGSLFSGILCAFLTHPLDTIKSCMQGDVDRHTYRGFRHTIKTIAEQGVISAGFSPSASIKTAAALDLSLSIPRLVASITPFFRGFGARAAIIVVCFNIFSECKLAFAHIFFPSAFSS
uniref:Mitochondrial carrier protein n=1 Tax=Aureoumbra lagunensis TaxID=44058 RepID=A0A7S3K4K9_9STRA|mmetsp:Transcript_12835/g.19241  ORF Transcript_12835/g.19241 Transcript_12835/m.19241 type:complete len:306 (+) Transcript_12835:49-966(+)